MHLKTIIERLKNSGIPVAHHEFKGSTKNPAPDPPFCVYFFTTTARGADFAPSLLEQVDMVIELYTNNPHEEIEKQLEKAVFFDVEFKKFQSLIPSENLTQTAYEFTFLQKK